MKPERIKKGYEGRISGVPNQTECWFCGSWNSTGKRNCERCNKLNPDYTGKEWAHDNQKEREEGGEELST